VAEPTIQIVDLDEYDPTDAEIISWHEMMNAPDQLLWEYGESSAAEPITPQRVIEAFRKRREIQRGENHPLWAIAGNHVVGFIGINRFKDSARRHCAEIGFGVTRSWTGQGIGSQLLAAAIRKARLLGLKRLEADCLENNSACVAMLRKHGFAEEGLRVAAISKGGTYRGQRLFGLML
jgi:putative acetyltransferase